MIFLLLELDDVSWLILCFMNKISSTSALRSKRKTIEDPMEKHKICATDIERWVDKKISFKCNTLFQPFQTKYFQVFLQDDPSMELNKGVYKNISKSRLHWVAAKTLVLPYLDVIEWRLEG